MDTAISELALRDTAKVAASRSRDAASELGLSGRFNVEHWRDGRLLATYCFPNGIVDEGKDLLLNVMFHGTSAIGTWYIGMVDNDGYTALADDDTYDDIDQAGNGWDEFADYTVGGNATIRATWDEAAASTQSITSSTVATFDITASGTVKGLFVVGGTNAATKGDHTASGNYLWATALFTSGDVPVNSGDQLKLTYTVNA
jgi:uncharacterized Zn-binding protein involved in type VI secretion